MNCWDRTSHLDSDLCEDKLNLHWQHCDSTFSQSNCELDWDWECFNFKPIANVYKAPQGSCSFPRDVNVNACGTVCGWCLSCFWWKLYNSNLNSCTISNRSFYSSILSVCPMNHWNISLSIFTNQATVCYCIYNIYIHLRDYLFFISFFTSWVSSMFVAHKTSPTATQDCQLLDPKMNSAQVDLIFCDTRVKKKGRPCRHGGRPFLWEKKTTSYCNLMSISYVFSELWSSEDVRNSFQPAVSEKDILLKIISFTVSMSARPTNHRRGPIRSGPGNSGREDRRSEAGLAHGGPKGAVQKDDFGAEKKSGPEKMFCRCRIKDELFDKCNNSWQKWFLVMTSSGGNLEIARCCWKANPTFGAPRSRVPCRWALMTHRSSWPSLDIWKGFDLNCLSSRFMI